MTDTKKDEKQEAKADGDDSQASENNEANTQDQGEGNENDSSQEGAVDYKAEFDRVNKQLSKAEHTIEKNRKGGDSKEDTKVDAAEVERLATEKATEIVRQQIEEFSTGLVADVVEEGLGLLTSNSDERKLMEFHYEKTIKKSGHTRSAIMNDLRRCKLLANESVISQQNTELAAALRSEQGKNKSGQASGERKQSAARIELTASEETLAQRMYARGVKVSRMNAQNKPATLEDARRTLYNAKTQN